MSRSDFPIWALVVVAIGAAAFLAPVVITVWWVVGIVRRAYQRADEMDRRLRAESDKRSF
jgi:hypothetical protein